MSTENPLAFYGILKTSATHLQTNTLIKDLAKSVNTWDSSLRPTGHQSISQAAIEPPY